MSSGNRTTIPTIIGVAVIMLVIGMALGSIIFPMTKTETMRQLNTITATQTLISIVDETGTRNITVTQTQSNLLSAEFLCSPIYFHEYFYDGTAPPNMPVIFARQNTTVAVCVQFYYYNSAIPETFNTASLLNAGILGTTTSTSNQSGIIPPLPFKLNFSISAYPGGLTLGGSSNLNEGKMVLYVIGTGDTSNGTYGLTLLAWLYPTLEICEGFTSIIVMNPSPTYVRSGSCTAPFSNFYPLNQYGFVDGFLTAKVVAMSNSSE